MIGRHRFSPENREVCAVCIGAARAAFLSIKFYSCLWNYAAFRGFIHSLSH